MKRASLSLRHALSGAAVAASAFALVLADNPTASAQSETLSGGIVPAGIVLVGTSLTLAPFSYIDENGDNVGFELDILDAVGERLEIDFSYVRVPFSQNFTALQAGVFRMSAAAAFMTCERLGNPEGVGVFSVPIYSAGQAISTKPELADKVNSLEDLEGLTVGIESVGSTADKVINQLAETVTFEKTVFSDNPSLFLALEQGRIDAAVQGEFSAAWQTRGNENVVIAHRVADTYFPVGYLFRQDDPLRDEFNRVLNELKEEGVLASLYEKWFQVAPDPEGPTVKVVPVASLENQNCS